MQSLKARTEVGSRPRLYAVPAPAERRRRLPNRVAYTLAASVIGLGLFASITPSPLYHAYSVLWRFSPLMAAFYVAAYASLSVPAVIAGVLVTHISLQATFEIFGSVVAAIALVVALEAWRTQPGDNRVPRTVPAPAQP
jgi:hypothetical protein